MLIEIDQKAGFCFGVTTAIQKSEEELKQNEPLYCLGDIVHNSREVERLSKLGLKTINHQDYQDLHHAKVLLRAHGEPPETYRTAEQNHIRIIDATCPVVLRLQQRIKQYFDDPQNKDAQIVIYGKNHHAEVLGLVGQTGGKAIVVENLEEVKKLDFGRDIRLYSQTTKSLDEFQQIEDYIRQHIKPGASFHSFNTICRQVANRTHHIRDFAARHQLVLFVSDTKSSNGRILFEECRKANTNSHFIDGVQAIDDKLLQGVESVGITGATSTPKWLMEEVAQHIREIQNH